MKMGSAKREDGVLKLVHPGGFVELHKEPITAVEVMNRNPRHCVTRTDVFKFPWIVVRPDSVLELGRVFFIVPNHTLYRLLQTSRPQRQSSSLRARPSANHLDHYQSLEQHPEHYLELTPGFQFDDQNQFVSASSRADATPKHQDLGCLKQKPRFESLAKDTPELQVHNRRLKQQFPNKTYGEMTLKIQDHGGCFKQHSRFELAKVTPERQNYDRCPEQFPTECYEGIPKQQNRDENLQTRSPSVGCWGDATPKHSKRQSLIELSNNRTPKHEILPKLYPVQSRLQVNKLHCCSSKQGKEQSVDNSGKQVMGQLKLKSCLRKPNDKNQRSRGLLKVTFLLPGEEEKEC